MPVSTVDDEDIEFTQEPDILVLPKIFGHDTISNFDLVNDKIDIKQHEIQFSDLSINDNIVTFPNGNTLTFPDLTNADITANMFLAIDYQIVRGTLDNNEIKSFHFSSPTEYTFYDVDATTQDLGLICWFSERPITPVKPFIKFDYQVSTSQVKPITCKVSPNEPYVSYNVPMVSGYFNIQNMTGTPKEYRLDIK